MISINMGRRYLQDDRLRLRSFEPKKQDAEYLYLWENDVDSWVSAGTRNPLSVAMIKEYVLMSAESIVTKGEMALMIEELESGIPVGYLQFLDYDAISRRVGCGLYIAPEYRGKGYARSVVCLAEQYAFNHLGVRMLYADILSSNIPCCRLFESLGYRLTATLPEWHYAEGQWHNLNYYQKWNTQ